MISLWNIVLNKFIKLLRKLFQIRAGGCHISYNFSDIQNEQGSIKNTNFFFLWLLWAYKFHTKKCISARNNWKESQNISSHPVSVIYKNFEKKTVTLKWKQIIAPATNENNVQLFRFKTIPPAHSSPNQYAIFIRKTV